MSWLWSRLDWNLIDGQLPQFLSEVEELLPKIEGMNKSARRHSISQLDVAKKEVENLIKQPLTSKGFRVREKVANAANSMAILLRWENGAPDNYMKLANLAFELFYSLRPRDRYMNSLSEAIDIFLNGQILKALSQYQIDIVNVERQIQETLIGAYRKETEIPSDIKTKATGLIWKAYGSMRDELKEKGQFAILTELLEHLLPLVIPTKLPRSLETEKEKWLEDGRRYVPKIIQAIEASGQITDSVLLVIPDSVKDDVRSAANRSDPQAVADFLRGFTNEQANQLWNGLINLFEIKIPEEIPRNLARENYQLFKVGSQQLRARNYPDAARTFNKTWTMNVMDLALRRWYACALALSGQPEQAKTILSQGINLGDKDESTYWNLACLEYKAQHLKEAFNHMRQLIRIHPGDNKIVAAMMGIALGLKNEEFIIDLISKLPGIDYLPLGVVLAHDRGKWEIRDALLAHLLQVWMTGSESAEYSPPDSAQKVTSKEIEQAFTYFATTGRTPAGIEYFEARVQNFPRFHASLRFLGQLYLLGGNIDKALDCFYKEVEVTISSKVPDFLKHEACLRLLDQCVLHNQNEMGIRALEQAMRAKIKDDKIKSYREKFGSLKLKTAVQKTTLSPITEEKDQISPPDSADIKEQRQALADLANLGPQVGTIRSVGELMNARSTVARYLEALHLAHTEARSQSRLFDGINRIINLLAEFQSSREFPQRKVLGNRILENYQEVRELYIQQSQPDVEALKQTMRGLMTALGRVIADCGSQVGFVPELGIESLQRSIPEDDNSSSLVIRVTNPSEQILFDISLEVRCEHGVCRVVADSVVLNDPLQPRGSTVCLVPIRRDQPGDHETFTVQLRYSTAELLDIQPAKFHKFTLPVREFPPNGLPEPYIIGQAVPANRPQNFQGRNEELAEILRSIGDVGPQNSVRFLDGIRRVGKTSILNALSVRVPANIIPVKLDMHELSPDAATASSPRFLHQLCKAIEENIEKRLGIKVESPPLAEFEKDVTIFNAYINQKSSQIPEHRVLLIFDEFQLVLRGVLNWHRKIGTLDETPLNMLRSHLGEGNLLCVFTGSLKFYQLRRYVDHPLLGTLLPLAISFIGKEAVENVLRLPVQDLNVQFPNETVDLVWRLTFGYPWLVQAIGHECLRILNREHRLVVAPADIEEVVTETILTRDNYFEFWWDPDQLTQREANVVEAILRHQKAPGEGVNNLAALLPTMDRQSLMESMKTLIDLEVVTESKGNVRIRALLLERWLSRRMQARGNRLVIERRISPEIEIPKGYSQVMIVIDHENIFLSLLEEYNKNNVDLNERLPQKLGWIIDRMLKNAQKYGEINRDGKVAVAVWDSPKWIQHLRPYAERDFKTPLPERFKKSGDQVTDFKLQAQILLSLASTEGEGCGTVILVAGDHHYLTIARELRNLGKRVVLWGVRNHTDTNLRVFAGEDFAWLQDLLGIDGPIIQDEVMPS